MKRFAVALALTVAAGLAAAFPDKPVRIVVPYPAGGAADTAARIVAERLAERWKQPVLVENKPGASGAIATEQVAKAPADGHTLLLHSPIMIATELIRPVGYRSLKDFAAVSTVLGTPVVFVASNEATQGGLKEILAYAASHPGELSFGSHGDGSSAHYLGERLAREAHVQLTHVPYAGEAPILAALMGGHVKTAFVSGIGAKKVAESGRGRIIGLTSAKRSPLLPDVPTFAELGFSGFDRESFGMLLVPAATPPALAEQLAADVDRVLRLPEVRRRFLDLGVEPRGGTAADAAQNLQAEYAYWLRLVKHLGALAK